MDSTIICPHCKQSIPLSDALSHEIREEFRKQAIDYTRKKDAEYKQKLEEVHLQFEEERKKSFKETEEKLRKKVEEELSLKLQDSKNESEEIKKHNSELQDQLLELTKTLRELKNESERSKLELEKKLSEEQDKIRTEERKRMDEEFRLKIAEKDKQLEDTKKALLDAQRKSEQVSQQLQGEVLELEMENMLHTEFPLDEIRPVSKGIRGGDIIQLVKNNQGRLCGTILWEFKRTKSWSNEWVVKLKDDQRSLKAEVAVIITEVLPNEIKHFGHKDGVWVGGFNTMLGLGYAMRRNLLDLAQVKMAQEGKKEKMEVLYNYIYGTEFKQRTEAIMEAFTALQESMEKEKRWFAAKWAKDEMNIRRVLDNTMGMRGDLQSISGNELSDPELELLEDGNTEQEKLL